MNTEMNKQIQGDTPTLRLFSLLEIISTKDCYFSLQSISGELDIPKPTLHRMLQQLEAANLIVRDGDGRQYSVGRRLVNMAEHLLINNTMNGARNQVLRSLVNNLGESCNITACNGSEVIYLDRVETPEPLRFHLHAGSRVPIHCSATGKLFLAQMSQTQRRRLLSSVKLTQYTENTITSHRALEKEILRVREQGYAVDNEEFLPGLFCIGVLVPKESGKSNLGLATQAPVIRSDLDTSIKFLPQLREAAQTLARLELDTQTN